MKKSVMLYCPDHLKDFEKEVMNGEKDALYVYLEHEIPTVPHFVLRLEVIRWEPTYAHERPRPSFWFRFRKAWKEARKTFRSTLRVGK